MQAPKKLATARDIEAPEGELAKSPIKRRLKRDVRRERIVDAAIELFSANSYDNTKIEDIAAASDCTSGPIYHLFGGKEDIFVAAYTELSRRYTIEFRKALTSDKDPLSKIVDICHRFFELPGLQASEFARSALRVLGHREVLERQQVARMAIRDLLREAMISGEVSPLPAEPLAHLIFGIAIEALSLAGIADDPRKATLAYKTAIEALVMGLKIR